jgi:glycosyltransferase involved in cell wall biosynthesis
MRQVVGIVGSGMVGRDPFDPRCWSRISKNFFEALQRQGRLHRAFGVEVPAYLRYPLMALDFRRDRNLWRSKFNLDPRYYALLTRAIRKALLPTDLDHHLLQIGGHYDSVEACAGRAPCCSYHDGNVAQLMRGPNFPPSLKADGARAFRWEKAVYARLTRIFVMNEFWRNSFINDFDLPADKVVNVGVGLNLQPPASVADKDYSRAEILFVGIDFERKAGPLLVRALDRVAPKHPGAKLHVVGPHQRPAILDDGKDRPHVVFHGHLSRENPEQVKKLFELLHRCTIVVLPSLYEPLGVALLEGMAFGAAGVASNAWSFPELIQHEVDGLLFSLGNEMELADVLDRYLANPDLRAAHGRRAHEKVVAKYSWDLVAQRIGAAIG